MNLRTTLTRAAAILSVLASVTLSVVVPASAGTPYSPACSDGIGLVEVPLMTSPITLGAELTNVNPFGSQIQLCYSTTPRGSGGGVTGGYAYVQSQLVFGVTQNTVRVTVTCKADDGVTLPVDCFEQTIVQTFPAGLPAYGQPNSICLVDIGTGCLLLVNGYWVQLPPVLRVTLPVGTIDVPPVRCIAILATCP